MRDHSKKLFITVVETSDQEDLSQEGKWKTLGFTENESQESTISTIQIWLTGRAAN